jgi:hypothetical protein
MVIGPIWDRVGGAYIPNKHKKPAKRPATNTRLLVVHHAKSGPMNYANQNRRSEPGVASRLSYRGRTSQGRNPK